MDKATVAKELLELEEVYQHGTLTDKQSERWRDLATELFGDENVSHQRRSFRLDAGVDAHIKIRSGSFTCKLSEVSRLGAKLEGQVFNYITHEDRIELLDAKLNGEERPLNLVLSIARIGFGGRPLAGVEIAAENDAASRERFFDRLYYPLYLQYLRKQAQA